MPGGLFLGFAPWSGPDLRGSRETIRSLLLCACERTAGRQDRDQSEGESPHCDRRGPRAATRLDGYHVVVSVVPTGVGTLVICAP